MVVVVVVPTHYYRRNLVKIVKNRSVKLEKKMVVVVVWREVSF